MNADNAAERGSAVMNISSTSRVRQHRQRQREAGRKRIALYLDHDVHLKLQQLAGEKGQARFLEELVKAAIEHEWRAIADQKKKSSQVVKKQAAEIQPRQEAGTAQLHFSGRRRNRVIG